MGKIAFRALGRVIKDRKAADRGCAPDGDLGIAMLPDYEGVDVSGVDPGILGDGGFKP